MADTPLSKSMGVDISAFTESEIELGADFLVSSGVRAKSEPEQGYIVIGNFVTEQNALDGRPYSISSGFNETNFLTIVEDFRARHKLTVHDCFDDSVVLEGNEKDLAAAIRELGPRFSFVHTNAAGVEAMLEAEEEFARKNPGVSIYTDEFIPPRSELDA